MTVPCDVAVVGGGPAGLTAALKLSRGRRRTVVFDVPLQARNAVSHGSHGVVGLDGIDAKRWRDRAWADIDRYGFAARREVEIRDITRFDDHDGTGFVLHDAHGGRTRATQVLLAVGTVDVHPDIEGFAACWARTVIHCPFCLGWENRDRTWGVVADDPGIAKELAAAFGEWSDDVRFFANGVMADGDEVRAVLAGHGRDLVEGAIRRLRHRDGDLYAVELADGTVVPRQTLMWQLPNRPVPLVTRLAGGLGLRVGGDGAVEIDDRHRTSVPGVFAAGDVASDEHGVVEGSYFGSNAAYWMIAES